MSWLSEWLGIDDEERKRRAEDAAEVERQRQAAERDRLQGIYGTNSLNSLQAQLEQLNRLKQTQGYDYQKAQANAMGGSYSYDLNGDGQIGAGETNTVDPRQSMAGRFGQQMLAKANRSGLTNSTLGAGTESRYSKNLQDQLFDLQMGQSKRADEAQSDLTAQMGALGNQAGVTYSIDPATGKMVKSGGPTPVASAPAQTETPEQSVNRMFGTMGKNLKFVNGKVVQA